MTDRIQLNDDGSLDEVVAGGAHLEHLGGKAWFLAMRRADGSEFCVWFTGKITMTEDREPVQEGGAMGKHDQIQPPRWVPSGGGGYAGPLDRLR